MLGRMDVAQHVARYRDDIGDLAGLECADIGFHPEELGGIPCCG